MSRLRKIIWGVFISIAVILLALYITGYDYILKGVRVVYMTGHSTAFIDDHKYFDNRVIHNDAPQKITRHPHYDKTKSTQRLDSINEALGTIAFLIIKDDQIWYEKYDDDYGPTSQTNSFSMAKSITTMLLGKAIEDGYINGLNQKVIDFYPDLKGEFAEELTVGDLASMSSGLNWDENYYSPFSMTAQAYYDGNIRDLILGLEVTEAPNQSFKYLSGNTQLLGMVIEKAIDQPLSNYLSSSFWKPLGMEDNALWQLDGLESGMEKTYCCISSNARDFSKIGMLYKNHGKWNGKQLLDSTFTAISTQPKFEDAPEYGYGFWLSNHLGKQSFIMRGILGQYVISIPEDNIIITRLGHQRSKEKINNFPKDMYIYMEEAYQMLNLKN
ncbi:MAG: beta-lactamase family protein [Flavobacteriaceae bacterium]|nr:beta-lactamase family protein [Flavobacteriaceae bacterium]